MRKICHKLVVAALFLSCTTACTVKQSLSFASKDDKQAWKLSVRMKRKNILPEPTPLMPLIAPQPLALAPPCVDVAMQPLPMPAPAVAATDPMETVRDSMIVYAKQFLGTPYRSRGSSKRGFDCSGFTSYVMSRFGYQVPASSSAQARVGETVDLSSAKKGDLLFFGYKGHGNSYRVSHAAMVISEPGEELKFIHSSRRGIVIDDINSSSWRSYYAKRVLFAKDVLKQQEEEQVQD